MPSSTSNSDTRLPEGPWLRTWIVGLVLFAVAVGGWELFWRSEGFKPSGQDDATAWVIARLELRPDSTVLVGTSRIQTDLDPLVWKDTLGGRPPVQLGLTATPSLPVLESLAADESFKGLVLFGIASLYTFDGDGGHEGRAHEMLGAYDLTLTSPAKRAETWLAKTSGSPLVLSNPALGMPQLLRDLWAWRRPEVTTFHMRPDRFTPLDFRKTNLAKIDLDVFETMGRAADEVERDAIIARIEHSVARIQARGGQVVLLALPASGERKALEERRYPRARYWDALVAGVSALAIHSDDHPELSGYTCGDGSHLDVRDTAAFTRALARIVRETLDRNRRP